jgi:ribonuclease HIII
MAQRTFVDKLSRSEQESLRSRLGEGEFEFRSLDHAHFSARGEGVVATLYRSGKLVVQGSSVDLFVERYLGREVAPEPEVPEGPSVGGDESGKGDYFGPLVVAAVRLGEGDAAKLKQAGVTDSKQVSDQTIRRQAPLIAEHFGNAVRVVDPPEYNRLHADTGNVAIVLSDLYREVMSELAKPGDTVLIDQFSKDASRLEKAMSGLGVQLVQMHRAERYASVAAASFLARAAFLDRLAELSDEVAVDLPKGAGTPVEKAARRFLRIHGSDKLGEVAKLHFRTTEKVGGRRA